MQRFRIVICGSFRKHFTGICEAIEAFERQGVEVLSPQPSAVINPGEEFAILETDRTDDPRTLESQHLQAIEAADAVYFYNPGGYLGASATLELGWSMALGKPTFALCPGQDVTLKLFIEQAATPEETVERLRTMEPAGDLVNERSSMPSIQRYLRGAAQRRGFDDETPNEVLLLLVEEVGELAKALRKELGLKVDAAKLGAYGKVQEEIADVLIYILHLANQLNCSAADAMIRKEQQNEVRYWAVASKHQDVRADV